MCLTKIRRHPGQRPLLLAAFQMVEQLPLTFVDVNFIQVLELSERTGLTAYDASFLWFAQNLDVELVTLDKAVAWAFDTIRP